MNKVLLFSPVQLDAPTLALTLKSHQALRAPGYGSIDRLYFNDNVELKSAQLLYTDPSALVTSNIIGLPESRVKDYRAGGGDSHQWNASNISRVARIKNEAIKTFLQSDYTHLFLVDSDLILHPDLINHLLSLGAPCASEVFWTNWEANGVYAPNVWDIHPYGHRSKESILSLRDKGQRKIGGLGACTLIRRDVLEAGVNFEPLPSTGFEGEDRTFSVRAEVLGFELIADTHYPPFHVYRKEQLPEAEIWYGAGAPPEYFKECWLNEEWEKKIHSAFNTKNLSSPSGGTKYQSLAICLPGEMFSGKYLSNILSTYEYALRNFSTRVFVGHSSDAAVTRWAITNEVLSHCFNSQGVPKAPDYVLWIDDDNVVCAGALQRLIEDLEAHPQLDIVAGWCMTTCGKSSVGHFDEEGYLVPIPVQELESATSLIGIDWSGFPCLLMRGELMATLGAQAFTRIADEHGKLPWGYFGEDASFFKRALISGARSAVDPRVKIPHLKIADLNDVVPIQDTKSQGGSSQFNLEKKEELTWQP